MSRAVLQVFETYQAARTSFVATIADLANRPANIEHLQNAQVMSLLRPLLLDTVPSIQHSAALALGRLANYSEALAESVVVNDVLPQLVYSLKENNRFYKKTAAFVLKSVAKHNAVLAQAVIDAGSLPDLVQCLQEFDPAVKEAAAWALGYIGQHSAELAQQVVEAGAIAPLVLCLQEPELSLKRVAASTFSEIAKHSSELAQVVTDAGAVPYLTPMVQHPDAKLKRQVCNALAQIAKHNADLAEIVVEAEIFPKIFLCLKDTDAIVKKNAALCVREIAKHTPELSQLIVNAGGHAALINYLISVNGAPRLPAILALGYIGAFSETLATSIIIKQGLLPLKTALIEEEEDHIRAATAWTLGQLGRHTPDHAKALAQADILRFLVDLYASPVSSSDTKEKAEKALKSVVAKTTYLAALEPLIHTAPYRILQFIVQQFAKALPNNPQARKSFVTSRGLARLQEVKAMEDSNKQNAKPEEEVNDINLNELISVINSCYPADIVQFYSPNYAETLINRLGD